MVSTIVGELGAGFADGNGTYAIFNEPLGITIDSSNNLYIADSNNHKIRKIDTLGDVTTVAGDGNAGYVNGTVTSAQFNGPRGIAIDLSGNLYVGDYNNNVIRKISTSSLVSTFAGDGSADFSDGTASNTQFYNPLGITIDSSGTFYICDKTNQRIRKIVFSNALLNEWTLMTNLRAITTVYNPANPGLWVYPPPTTLNAAIDRIAQKIINNWGGQI
jgi:streptogramin lyase